jgi:hypothetical protein
LQVAPADTRPKPAKELAYPNARTEKYAAKMKDRITKVKNGQLVTGGIFYCRDSGYFSVSASNKLSYNLTGQCFEIGNKNIPPIRYQQA